MAFEGLSVEDNAVPFDDEPWLTVGIEFDVLDTSEELPAPVAEAEIELGGRVPVELLPGAKVSEAASPDLVPGLPLPGVTFGRPPF